MLMPPLRLTPPPPAPMSIPVEEKPSKTPALVTEPSMIRPKLLAALVPKLPIVIGAVEPISSDGAEPLLASAPVPSTLSTMPSPSASVVV